MKNLTWQNPEPFGFAASRVEELFVAQVLIKKVKPKCCGIWAMKQKLFSAFVVAVLLLGMMSACTVNDNPASGETDITVPTVDALEIADGEFEPIEVNVALLGSLSNPADAEAARWWLKDVTTEITDETQVVITDQITDANKKAIRKVLKRYGTLLLVYPDEANVKQYADYLGVDPDADYSMLEMIGLSGFGDQFLSYAEEADFAPIDVAPSSISLEDLFEVAPTEYLRMKAFAQWVDKIDKKYAAYEASKQEIIRSNRAGRRSSDGNIYDKLDLAKLPKIDRTINLTGSPDLVLVSYKNSGRDADYAACPLSITCNYQFMPVFEFPHGGEPGADYYIVETTVSWDLTETVKGTSIQDHGSGRNRRSYFWFPHLCEFYSTPITTNNKYSVMVPKNGDLEPEGEVLNKDVTMSRSFNINGQVSAGANDDDGPHADANLGFSADYSKDESYNVQQFSVNPKQGAKEVGHVISVPNDYRPIIGGDGDPEIIVPQGANFKRSLIVKESWVWKVSGTETDTKNSAIKVQFNANPEVAWYSYFYTTSGLDVKAHTIQLKPKSIVVPAPNRRNVGFLKITADTENEGELTIFAVKAYDVTDGKTKKIAYEKSNLAVGPGEVLKLALAAKKKYTIEVQMGTNVNQASAYVLENWEVDGKSTVQELKTSTHFKSKDSQTSWDYDDYELIGDEHDDEDD